ncbi:hypothetical protein K493DRAFT_321654 [Basidiobolus meristosporus CBS 931.73]|uniref:Uncharacterized protein n=1 Tax=Basidiobolus meristosporus CBS 931.73 TaxID=1314790 RepID=A0A1Y1WQI7_9FUNG|nr:hypothetical protein K493DRAFT_321654 [Basidiobolus meristosporus CBS 931.73]|eukprot:ORX75790.1 hypothetical protein K493DRAFT_321654 [Basidiobolus meristosporus CBS 931.73]
MSTLSLTEEEHSATEKEGSFFDSDAEDSTGMKSANLPFPIFSTDFQEYHQNLELEYKRAKRRNREQAEEIEELRRRTKLSQIQIEAAKQEFKQTQSRNSELLSYLNQVKAGLLPVLLRIEQKLGETGEGPPDSQCSPEEFVRYTRELSAKVARRKMKSEQS